MLFRSDSNEYEMLSSSKIAAYGKAKRYINSFDKGDYALFYSKGRGVIAVGRIIADKPEDIGDERFFSVEMIVPDCVNVNSNTLPSITPSEIKRILGRNFFWASTIKSPFLSKEQTEQIIRALKDKHN